jgi:hypothetical protein
MNQDQSYQLVRGGLGVGRRPGGGGLDEVGYGVPETHCWIQAGKGRRAVSMAEGVGRVRRNGVVLQFVQSRDVGALAKIG